MKRIKTSQQVPTLTLQEKKDRKRCHRKIINFRKSKIEAAMAMAEMHEKKLFRPLTFAEYCSRIPMSTKTAYGLMRFVEIHDLLAKNGIQPLPTSEGQTRPVQSLTDEEIVEIWKRAAKNKGRITWETVEAARDAYARGKPNRKPNRKPDQKAGKKQQPTNPVPRQGILLSVGRWLFWMAWLLIAGVFLRLLGRFGRR